MNYGIEWVKKGYDPGTLEHRLELFKVLRKYSPFDSLLDVGCASGPDLYLYKMAWENTKLIGFDKAPENVKQAKERGLDVYEADLLLELPEIADKSFDIVLTNGVLMYVDMSNIKELLRIAKKAVILSERDPEQKMLRYFEDELHLAVTVTKITQEIRDSWKVDGFIYEITL